MDKPNLRLNNTDKSIVVLDYSMGNVGSIKNMFKKLRIQVEVSDDNQVIENATHLVLPGVGAFDKGMSNLRNKGFLDLVERKVIHENIPILGICLGMQLMTHSSEEGDLLGLGWVDAVTKRFRLDQTLQDSGTRIPHMGWNEVNCADGHPLFAGYDSPPHFYFVHSYYVDCKKSENSIATTTHGISFTSSFMHDNIFGVQFHPEKSHRFGLKLLSNFVSI